jgi:hypothetical protein
MSDRSVLQSLEKLQEFFPIKVGGVAAFIRMHSAARAVDVISVVRFECIRCRMTQRC